MLIRPYRITIIVPKRQKNLYLEIEDVNYLESFEDRKANEVATEAIAFHKQGLNMETPVKPSKFKLREIIQ